MTSARSTSWAQAIALVARRAAILAVLASIGVAAGAGENLSYGYDALGRLVKVSRTGTVNNNTTECYAYDPASNRSNVTVSTTSDCAGAAPGTSFSIGDVSVTEGGTATFTVTRSGSTTGTNTVNYQTEQNSAVDGSDYTGSSGTLTFAAGVATQQIQVPTLQDSAIEGSESFNVNLLAASGGATISDTQGVATINDDDAAPSFSINNASATEGGTVTFTVTRSGPTTGSYTINYITHPNTTTEGSDYTAKTGTLTFAAGVTTQQVQVTTIQDSAVEGNETFYLDVYGPSGGATVGDGRGVGTIIDNDSSAPSFSINDASAAEGSTVTFFVTRSAPTTGSYTVNYATQLGSASPGSDYTTTSGTLTFLSGVTSKSVAVTTLHDTAIEGNETFVVNLSAPSGGATISDGQGQGTIIDPPPCSGVDFGVADSTVTEGSNLSFAVIASGAASTSCSVNYATSSSGGTAAAGSDYTATSGTLTFPSAPATLHVIVPVIDDSAVEGAEQMYLNLSSASTGAGIGDPQGIGTINDNDSGSNQPPTPVDDSASARRCDTKTITVTANDTDPDGDYPLSVIAVAGAGFSVVSSTQVRYINDGTSGQKLGTYTVQDSRGATAQADINVTVSNINLCQ